MRWAGSRACWSSLLARLGKQALDEHAGGPPEDLFLELTPIAQQREARGDREVGGVELIAAQHAVPDPGVNAVQQRGHTGDELALVSVVCAERVSRHARERP